MNSPIDTLQAEADNSSRSALRYCAETLVRSHPSAGESLAAVACGLDAREDAEMKLSALFTSALVLMVSVAINASDEGSLCSLSSLDAPAGSVVQIAELTGSHAQQYSFMGASDGFLSA
jgi:hypothetical protein